MLDKMKYINNKGDVIRFGERPYYVNENELRNFTWDYDTYGDKITSFTRGITEKKLPILIYDTDSKDSFNALCNTLEYDVINNARGKLYVGDYYLLCNFIESSKSDYTKTKGYLSNEYKIVTDMKWWIKETKTSFRTGITSNDGNLNYPFNYPFNYASSTAGKKIGNESYAPSDFEMIIYGSCLNPSVAIGGHLYGVDCSLETGEYLVVNSITKKIYKVKTNGDIVNQFNLRNRDSYIFEKIPSGDNAVTWSGLFGFDVILLSERSEPLWT